MGESPPVGFGLSQFGIAGCYATPIVSSTSTPVELVSSFLVVGRCHRRGTSRALSERLDHESQHQTESRRIRSGASSMVSSTGNPHEVSVVLILIFAQGMLLCSPFSHLWLRVARRVAASSFSVRCVAFRVGTRGIFDNGYHGGCLYVFNGQMADGHHC